MELPGTMVCSTMVKDNVSHLSCNEIKRLVYTAEEELTVNKVCVPSVDYE